MNSSNGQLVTGKYR